jgi:hypothetical protein
MLIRQQRLSVKSSFPTTAALALLLIAFSLSASAQEAPSIPKYTVFGGFSYMRFDGKKLGFADYTNLGGVNGEASANIWRKLGAVADVSANFGTDQRVYDFLIGPQYSFRKSKAIIFARGFYGRERNEVRVQHTNPDGSSSGRYLSIRRVLGGGGGVDYEYTPRLTFRVQVDYLRGEAFSSTQNNIRASGGLVWHFGGK